MKLLKAILLSVVVSIVFSCCIGLMCALSSYERYENIYWAWDMFTHMSTLAYFVNQPLLLLFFIPTSKEC